MPLRTFMLAASFTLLSAAAAVAGPPWISVELPANPHHASTRDASFVIRAYHHSGLINVPVQGVAYGLVDGRRVSMPLDIRTTNTAGVYAVRTAIPRNGAWVMSVTLNASETATATALVSVDSRGRIVAVDVPNNRTRDGWSVPRAVTSGDIDAALRAVAAVTAEAPSSNVHGAWLALPVLLVGGLMVRRRTRQ